MAIKCVTPFLAEGGEYVILCGFSSTAPVRQSVVSICLRRVSLVACICPQLPLCTTFEPRAHISRTPCTPVYLPCPTVACNTNRGRATFPICVKIWTHLEKSVDLRATIKSGASKFARQINGVRFRAVWHADTGSSPMTVQMFVVTAAGCWSQDTGLPNFMAWFEEFAEGVRPPWPKCTHIYIHT